MLKEKYKSVIDVAEQGGVNNLRVEEKGNVLHIGGTTTEAVKRQIWDTYKRGQPEEDCQAVRHHVAKDFRNEQGCGQESGCDLSG